MQRAKLALVCLSWLGLASAAFAQTQADPNYAPGVASLQGSSYASGGGLLYGTYFDVRHVIGDGVGYQNSYSQIGAFTPIWLTDDTFIAPNTRLIVTNSTQTGVNTGLVGRTYVNSLDRVFGVYGYYDNDEDSRNYRYNQVTVGAETLGQWLDVRGNAYLQTGNSSNFIQAQGLIPGQLPFYVGHNIDFVGTQLRDQALGGADAEVGAPVSQYAQWLRVYGGAYGYRTGTSNTIGFRGRMEAMVSNDLTLGLTVSNDAIYGTNINGTIDFKFSGFNPTQYFPNLTTRQRMLNPTQRNWRIATRTYVQDVDVAAINPATSQPYFVTHVNNTAPAGGDGTIEHPLNTLQTSPPADIILVHMGNANTPATAVTGFAQLSNNQRLLGDGLPSFAYLYAQYGNSTIAGNYQLPQTNNSGNLPFITNPLGDVVSLANNNEVANLNFVNAAGNAITNTVAGSNNFFLHDLNITGNGGMGINLTNASGIGQILNINQGTTNFANPLGLGNNAAGGIQIGTGGPGLGLQLSNVSMNANPAGSQAFGISLNANNGSLLTNLFNVSASGNGDGILVSETSQPTTVNMQNVQANGNLGVGVGVSGVGGSINLYADNVTATGNASDNLQFGSAAAPIVTSFVNVTLNNSNFSNSTGGSGIVFSQSGGAGNYTLASDTGVNVTSILNAVDGLGLYSTNSNVMNTVVHSAQLSANGRDAIHVFGDTAGVINLYVDPTVATNSGRDAFNYSLNHDSILNATLVNNQFDFSGRSAMYGQLQNFATANIFANYTTGGNSGADGFYLNASGQSVANIEVDHGTFAASGQLVNGSSAMNIISDNSTIGLLTDFTPGNNRDPITNAVSNQSYGLTLNLTNGSLFNGTIENSSFSDNLVNGINATVNSSSAAMLTLFNTAANNSGADGYVVNVDNAYLNTVSTNSDVNNSVGNGFTANVTNGGILNTTFDNSNVNNSGGNGMNLTVAGATSAAGISVLNGGTINNSGINGVLFNVDAGELSLTTRSSSISFNGTSGIGSGVLGTVVNTGLTVLEFDNTPINSNLDNGVYVSTNTGGNIRATFNLGSVSNNGLAGITGRHNDGIRLDMDGATSSWLKITNGASVNGNGDNGVTIMANNSTNFQGQFENGFIVDNGQAAGAPTAAGVNVTSSNLSSVNLTFNGFSIGNSLPGGTQQYGFLSDSNTGSLLTAMFTTTTLNNNANNAINSTVETNSTTSFNLINAVGNSSGSSGAVFDVLTGGQLLMTSSINSGFSNNGGSGIVVSVDGATSSAFLGYIDPMTMVCNGLDMIHLDNNGGTFGGAGLSANVTNGGFFSSVIEDASTITNNRNQGIQLTANTNSNINMVINESDVNSNSSEGLAINAQDGSTVNLRSWQSNFSANGVNGTYDGVNILALGAGPANTATVQTLFEGGTINGNTGNGMSLEALNGATLTTSIAGVDISNNGGYGVLGKANGINTAFNLLMTGANTLNGNAQGPIGPLTFNNIAQATLIFSGSFNNSPNDGVNVNLTNVANGLVAFEGPGTVNNSHSNGVEVNFTNVGTGSVLIDGITSINNSGADGIKIDFNNVGFAGGSSIGILGTTQIDKSGGKGIEINATNSTLVAVPTFSGAGITVVSPFDPANQCILSTSLFDPSPYMPPAALVIANQNVSNSGSNGIFINLLNSTIQANQSFLQYNNVSNSGADGILISANHSNADGMTIIGTSSSGNVGNGLNIIGSNISSLQNMVITKGVAVVNTGLDFTIVGDTYPTAPFPTGSGQFNLINTSTTPGENVTSFTLDTSTSVTGAIFDTSIGAAYPFTPFNNTDVNTGLATVNGIAVPPYPASLVPDFTQYLGLTFNSFAPGKNFQWDNDFDFVPNVDATVLGSDLIGSKITVGFTGGYTLQGSLVALPGDPTGSHFVATSGNIGGNYSNNGLDGVKFSLDSTNMSNLNITNISANSNGSALNTGHGIEFTGGGGAVNSSNLSGLVMTGNTMSLNHGDGIRLVNPVTTNAIMDINIANNTITQNTGTGINLNLVTGHQDLTFTGLTGFSDNKINQNAGGPGLNVQLAANHNLTGDFTGNQINGNGTQGINLNMGTNGVVASNFTNNVIDSNKAQGINIALATGGQFNGGGINPAQFYGNEISNNLGIGVNLVAPDGSSFNWALGSLTPGNGSNTINGNTSAGVAITMSGAATGTLSVANSQFANTLAGTNPSYAGEGLNVNLTGSSSLTGGILKSSFNNNAGDGALFHVTGTTSSAHATLNNFTIDNNSIFSNNTGNGLEFVRSAFGILTGITVQNSFFDNNTLNGIAITAANKNDTDHYDINNNDISNNLQNGLLITEMFQSKVNLDMNVTMPTGQNTITHNGASGIQVNEIINVYATDERALSGTWKNNIIAFNAGNGIAVDGATNGLIIGDTATLNPLGNVISNNGLNGIEVGNRGSLTIENNSITFNGNLANLGTVTQNAGIMLDVKPGITIDAPGGPPSPPPIDSTVVVAKNLISNNYGDGIEYGIAQHITNFPAFTTGFGANVSIDTNTITYNSGRGVNLINRGDNYTQANISNNIIAANQLEGIYVVNTASLIQDQNSYNRAQLTALEVGGGVPLGVDPADGAISTVRNPILELRVTGNQILGNGLNSGTSGTGLVIQVGTSGGNYFYNNPGGFASNTVLPKPGINGSPFGYSSGYGGVTAVVDTNTIGGNAGKQILFGSYVSTNAPPATAGTWSTTQFFTTNFWGDPLSRFDLFFRNDTIIEGTTFAAIDPVGISQINYATNLNGYSTNNPAFLAFYNNSDSFKSNQSATTPTTATGPFGPDAGRDRNATRQAARLQPFDAPLAGNPAAGSDGGQFLYPGLGASTWRVSSDSSIAFLTMLSTNNLLDPLAITNVFQEQGIPVIDPPYYVSPWGWGEF